MTSYQTIIVDGGHTTHIDDDDDENENYRTEPPITITWKRTHEHTHTHTVEVISHHVFSNRFKNMLYSNPIVNCRTGSSNSKRQLLVRVGSWMKQSWRSRSSRSIASLSSTTSFGGGPNNRSFDLGGNGSGSGVHTSNNGNNNGFHSPNNTKPPPKHVQFEDVDFLETMIPDPYDNEDENNVKEEEEESMGMSKENIDDDMWFQVC